MKPALLLGGKKGQKTSRAGIINNRFLWAGETRLPADAGAADGDGDADTGAGSGAACWY